MYFFSFFTYKTVSFQFVGICHFHHLVKLAGGPVWCVRSGRVPRGSAHCVPLTWRPDSYPLRDQEGGGSWWEAKRPVSQRKRFRLLENSAHYACGWNHGHAELCFLEGASVALGLLESSKRPSVVFVLFVLQKSTSTHTKDTKSLNPLTRNGG